MKIQTILDNLDAFEAKISQEEKGSPARLAVILEANGACRDAYPALRAEIERLQDEVSDLARELKTAYECLESK